MDLLWVMHFVVFLEYSFQKALRHVLPEHFWFFFLFDNFQNSLLFP